MASYVAEAGDRAVGFFYGQLFLRQPHLRELFPPAMDEQRDRLFRSLGRIVESLSTPEEMAAYLSQLGRDHRKYHVEPEMYETVGAALLATLRTFARDAFTSEAEEAWTQVYQAGSSLMIKAAGEDAARSPASWTAEVVKVHHPADNIAVLTIAPDQPLPFSAGQHLTEHEEVPAQAVKRMAEGCRGVTLEEKVPAPRRQVAGERYQEERDPVSAEQRRGGEQQRQHRAEQVQATAGAVAVLLEVIGIELAETCELQGGSARARRNRHVSGLACATYESS